MSIHTFSFLTNNNLWRIILVMIFRVIFNNTEEVASQRCTWIDTSIIFDLRWKKYSKKILLNQHLITVKFYFIKFQKNYITPSGGSALSGSKSKIWSGLALWAWKRSRVDSTYAVFSAEWSGHSFGLPECNSLTQIEMHPIKKPTQDLSRGESPL